MAEFRNLKKEGSVTPNEEQLAAAGHADGPALLAAGPGAGKTKVLVDRFAALLRRGERPEKILCVTFSAEAAKEMRLRISALTGFTEATLKGSVSTFHSLAYRIVREEKASLGWHLADYPVLPAGEDKKILRDLVRRDQIPAAKAYIARMRRSLISPQEAFARASGIDLQLAETYAYYDEALREEGALDFDAMVYYAVKTLAENPDALERWRARSRYVMVDEAHDTSHDQMQLASLLGGENLIYIFDLSQSIYSFRGAEPSLIVEHANGSKRFYLATNYRSGKNIIKAFAPFAETDELSQALVSRMRSGRDSDGTVVVEGFSGEYEEARAVVEEIAASGVNYEDVAVLARTRAALFPYYELLEERGIPFRWRGKNFWLSPEIVELVSFARFALDPFDLEAADSTKYLGRKFAQAVASAAKKKRLDPLAVEPPGDCPQYKLDKWETAKEQLAELRGFRGPAAEFFREVRNLYGARVYDSETEQPDDFSTENVEALVRRAERFGNLAEFLAHAARMSKRSSTGKGVTLSTIHSAKGLEWNSVFCVSVSDKVLPHKRGDFDEERRIMYVALSRARDYLWVSWSGAKSAFIGMFPEFPREAAVAVGQGRLAMRVGR